MEKTVQCLSGAQRLNTNGPYIFGIRHLSPASAYHLLEFLDKIQPKCVLIEGPSDCNDLLPQIADRRIKLPIALLSYTTSLPIKTVIYPLAGYSPEYQAILWAYENDAEVRFIDLPSSASVKAEIYARDDSPQGDSCNDDENGSSNDYYKLQKKFYSDTVEIAGECDYETFWERHFEHCGDTESFIKKITEFSRSMRESLGGVQWELEKRDASYNYIREAFMKREIARAAGDGFAPGEISVITGAYHVSGLSDGTQAPMSDDEYSTLPREEVKITLMPYSFYRLSSRSGYGAGNKAPAYFQLMWECIKQNDMEQLAPLYLSSIAGLNRAAGNYNSTASAIEAVRLARSLAIMHEGNYPALRDLHDAAVCLLGGGEMTAVSESIAKTDIGTAIGELPGGLSQTPVQDDMNRQIKRLKLEKYKTVVAQDITLDLRENRAVKSAEAAFADLNRSIFFNRLQLLGIGFAVYQGGASSAWSERWVLRWSPENEIEAVEATLKGETIETAAAFVLKEQFEAAAGILEIAKLIRKAYICGLLSEISNGLMRLQTLCTESGNFVQTAQTALEISNIITFREARNIETAPLIPVLQQVFLRAVLIMFDNASCDDDASGEFIAAIDAMRAVSQAQYEYVNDELWLIKLRELADSESRNAKISGNAASVLIERDSFTDDELRTEMARRLSYGVPGDIAALWFEGLSARNRYALLSRPNIWRQLDTYLNTLDADEFKRTLVFLRRAFGAFDAREKNLLTDILADLWGVNTTGIGEFLQDELSEEEQGGLDELNDFDFDI